MLIQNKYPGTFLWQIQDNQVIDLIVDHSFHTLAARILVW